MSTQEDRLQLLLKKIKAQGEIRSEDLQDLTDEEKNLITTLYEAGMIEDSLALLEDMDVNKDWEKLKGEANRLQRPVMTLWQSAFKYAAIFIGVIAVTYFVSQKYLPTAKLDLATDQVTLTIGENKIQLYAQSQTKQIVLASGEVIGKQDGDTLIYSSDSKTGGVRINELEIPNGKMFNVALSDGTMVHLNSGTILRYPEKFLKGQNREVFVEGEAYFEVAEDKAHPFIVHADNVAVEVLGTKFNVSSYKEDSEIATVLVQGSVQMSNTIRPTDNYILNPGTMGSWHRTKHSTKMENVDTDLYTGWIKGELIFRNLTFENIEKTLERKYNVVIDNKSNVLAKKVLTANFNTKIEKIEDVLKTIQEIYQFDYTIKDKHILIQAKTEEL